MKGENSQVITLAFLASLPGSLNSLSAVARDRAAQLASQRVMALASLSTKLSTGGFQAKGSTEPK